MKAIEGTPVDEIKATNVVYGGTNPDGVLQNHRPYWRRAHGDWRFWIAVTFILGCIAVYLLSGQLLAMLLTPELPQNWMNG